MIITTGHTLEGYTITQYQGIVTGAVLTTVKAGADRLKTAAWQNGIAGVNEILSANAERKFADAILGVQYFLEGDTLAAVGTAVKAVKNA